MFVSKKRYEQLEGELRAAINHCNKLIDQWNALVKRINEKGGEQFLTEGVISPPAQFSQDDLRRLIQLCHPDKHANSTLSVEMTQKLLSLKE